MQLSSLLAWYVPEPQQVETAFFSLPLLIRPHQWMWHRMSTWWTN